MTEKREPLECGTCRYFLHSPPPDLQGHCRRYPPAFRVDGQRAGAIEVWESDSAFPKTDSINWCGEYLWRHSPR